MPFAFELNDISALPDKDLTEATRILEGLYNLYRTYKNVKMMKLLKSVLEKIRMETGLRVKKVKADDRRRFIGDVSKDFAILKADAEQWLKTKGKLKAKNTEKKPISIIEEAMKADLKTDPMALQKLGKLIEKRAEDEDD